MPLFNVKTKVKTSLISTFQIEADNEEEAKQKVLDYGGKLIDIYDEGSEGDEKIISCEQTDFEERPW